jgi:hypothetical protein
MIRSTIRPALVLCICLGACAGKSDTPSADSAAGKKAGDTAAATTTGAAPAARAPLTPEQQKANEAQLADIASYRLTMASFDKYMAAQRNIVTRAARMTPAEREAARVRGAASPANSSIDVMIKNIEREPLMIGAVKDAGLTAREFALIGMSIMQGGMAAGVLKSRPDDNADSLIRVMKVNPENVKFVRENEAVLMAKQKELQEEIKKMQAAAPKP